MNGRTGWGRTFTLRGWLIVWLLPLAVVAGLVAGMVAVRPPSFALGVGDPYFPDAGAPGWDAQRYIVRISWDAELTRLSGTTVIEATATEDLPVIGFDLHHRVGSATVNGTPARAEASGPVNRWVVPDRPVRAGDRFVLEVSYAGDPGGLSGTLGDPFLREPGEILIAGEPEASAVWFAANDHPTDEALVDIAVTVPAGVSALSVGRLVDADADDDPATATWHWVSDEPMATYLTFLAVGDFEIRHDDAGGRPGVYAVSNRLPSDVRRRAMATLLETPGMIRELELRYGDYPFGQLGGVVTGLDPRWAGLEAQTRPVYDASLGRGGRWPDELLAHELAHQWFGNHVRVARWADIVNNEGWATFAAREVLARRQGVSMDDWLRDAWRRQPARFWRVPVSDPGVREMFGPTYERGAMALQALRIRLGDEAFFALAREWAQDPGARSLGDWRSFVDTRTSADLGTFWTAWYDATTPPERTPEFGWPG